MKIDKGAILSKVQQDIQNAENYYNTYIQPKVLERYQIYNADKDYYAKLFPKLSKRFSFTSTDVADKVEWALPSLIRIFFGSEEIISVKGRTAEDDHQAETMQKLINFQLQRLNPGFMIFYRWFKDALITGLGIVKCYWERDWETKTWKQVVGWDELQAAELDPNIEVVQAEDLGNGLYNATFKMKAVTKNQPVVENIPAPEFIFDPNAITIKDSQFVAHRKLVTADYLRRKAEEGWYDKDAVENAIEASSDSQYIDQVETYLKPFKLSYSEPPDSARRKILLYECYTKYDINGDGLLEDVIITVANGQILRIVENIYGRPPFFVISPILEPYQIWGKGFSDILADVQHIKTAVIRQIIVNIALNNDPKMFINEQLVNIDDILNDAAFIRVEGAPSQAMQPIPIQPLAPWTFNFLEYWETVGENRTGITRYTQGLDAKALNKTATGIQLIMNAANQRLELIARIFAETGIKELFEFLVELNQRFIDQETVIRLTNEPLIIRPDDIRGQFDLVINAGVGAGVKETTLQHLQLLIGLYPQLLQIGIATPKNVYNAIKKLIETLGFKNTDDFITDPTGGQLGQGQVSSGLPAGTPDAGAPQGLPANAGGLPQGVIQRLAEVAGQVAGNQGGAGGSGQA